MIKKLIVVVCMAILLGFSVYLLTQTKPNTTVIKDDTPENIVVQKQVSYTFNAQNATALCEDSADMNCMVENAVKCTINPDIDGCSSANLPSYIFMKTPSVERPTEISYKIVEKKIRPNNTAEVYTESSCNESWFGICEGTIVYVLHKIGNQWTVRDIYAIE